MPDANFYKRRKQFTDQQKNVLDKYPKIQVDDITDQWFKDVNNALVNVPGQPGKKQYLAPLGKRVYGPAFPEPKRRR